MGIRQNKYKKLIYLCAPLLTAAIILVIYVLRGYYPFGELSIVDNDLAGNGIPNYTYLYDVFHGDTSPYFDWYTAAGFERFALSGFLSPSIWFLLLFPRSMMYGGMAWLFILKMMLVGLTSTVFIKNVFPKLPVYFTVLFALLYTFSGYDLQYYTNIDWLDTVALFPLLILFALRAFQGKSLIPFVAVLTYLLTVNVYFSYFIFLFLILGGWLYIYIFMEKEKRRRAVFRFGEGTGLALLISAPVFTESLRQIFSTSRFEMTDNTGGLLDSFLEIMNAANTRSTGKILMLAGLEFALVALVLLWTKVKKDKKAPLFFTALFLLLFAQIALENVNLLWHGGSYMNFPLRNGYMLSLVLVSCAAYYGERFDTRDGRPRYKYVAYLLPALSVLAFYIIIPYLLVWEDTIHELNNLTLSSMAGRAAFWTFLYAFAAVTGGVLLFRLIHSRRIRTAFTALLLAITLCLNAYGFIGARCGLSGWTKAYSIQNSTILMNDAVSPKLLNRMNNADGLLLYNYSYYNRRASLSNWTHTLSSGIQKALWDMGFSTVYTLTLDSGGTAFSKALLGISNTVSHLPQDDALYTRLSGDGVLNYYANRYTFGSGLIFSGTLPERQADENGFHYQNRIYTALSGDAGPLFTAAKITDRRYEEKEADKDSFDYGSDPIKALESAFLAKKVKTTKYTLHIEKNSALYFAPNIAFGTVFSECEISVNGKPFAVSSGISSKTGYRYPTDFTNNFLELGVFEDEDVEIAVSSRYDLPESLFYIMDLDKLGAVTAAHQTENPYTAGDRDFQMDVISAADGATLFLPVGYSENWSCTVNGKEQPVEKVLGSFMGIRLQKGENAVVLKLSVYENYVRYAAVAALIGLCFFLRFMLRRKKAEAPEALLRIAAILFTALVTGVLLMFYAVPIAFTVKNLIAGFFT